MMNPITHIATQPAKIRPNAASVTQSERAAASVMTTVEPTTQNEQSNDDEDDSSDKRACEDQIDPRAQRQQPQ